MGISSIQSRVELALQKNSRTSDSIRLIGVSKKQTLETILPFLKKGLHDLGENYVQEWKEKNQKLQKVDQLAKKIRWHFIGHLQRNKAKEIVGHYEYIHTVDRLEIAEKISGLAKQAKLSQKVLLQVKLGNESSKSGFLPEKLLTTLPLLASLPNLSWQGLMTIPPPTQNSDQAKVFFRQLKSLLDECNQKGVLKEPMKELSMGMNQNFETAIACGATMIRVGEALFGKRS